MEQEASKKYQFQFLCNHPICLGAAPGLQNVNFSGTIGAKLSGSSLSCGLPREIVKQCKYEANTRYYIILTDCWTG